MYRLSLIFLIILLGFSGCGKKYKYKKYTDEKKQITINYPDSWQVKDKFLNVSKEVPVIVSFRPPDVLPETKAEDYIETITLTFAAGENDYLDIKKNLEKYIQAYTLIGEEKFSIDGKECNRIIYTGVQGEKFLSVDQIFYPANGGVYTFTYLSVPTTYEKYKKDFENIAKSLVVLK